MAIALAIIYFAHLILGAVPYPPDRFGMLIVQATPGDIATRTIETLGHWGLRALAIVVHAGALLLGSAAGLLVARVDAGEQRSRRALGLGVLFLIGSWLLALTGAEGAPLTAVVMYAVAGAAAARVLAGVPLSSALQPKIHEGQTPLDAISASRRTFIFRAVVAVGSVFAAGSIIARLFRRSSSANVMIVSAHRPFISPSDDPAFPATDGLTQEITSNADFYTVDINLIKPQVNHDTWNLSIGGMVERPYRLNYAELQREFEVVEMVHTLTCISNEVGGDLISTAVWRGVRLSDVLERAQLQRGVRDIVFRAVEGYSDSIPLRKALEETTLVVFGMNGEPLPRAHGFPARIIVPGIYGMKNVKWLTNIEAVDEDYQGYWMVRGWSDVARVKTQSRIDVPLGGRVTSGSPMAGISWAGDRGISRVEVSEDGGATWHEATLKRELSPRTWRLWARSIQGGRGRRRLLVRATDGANEAQEAVATAPHPNGASGYHAIEVEVE